MRAIDKYGYMSDIAVAWHTIAYHELAGEPFNDGDKSVIADALIDCMSPYDAAYELCNDIANVAYNDLCDDMHQTDDITVIDEWLPVTGYDNLREYITCEGLPLPDIDTMIENVVDEIDIIEYIDSIDDYLDVYHEHMLYNLDDAELVTVFDEFCNELVIESD